MNILGIFLILAANVYYFTNRKELGETARAFKIAQFTATLLVAYEIYNLFVSRLGLILG